MPGLLLRGLVSLAKIYRRVAFLLRARTSPKVCRSFARLLFVRIRLDMQLSRGLVVRRCTLYLVLHGLRRKLRSIFCAKSLGCFDS